MPLTPSTPWSGRRFALRASESLVWALTWPVVLCLPLLIAAESSPLRTTTRWIDRRHAWGDGHSAPPLRSLHRPAAFLAVDVLLGALSTVIWALIGFGLATAWSMILGAVTGGSVPLLDDAPPGAVTWQVVGWAVLPGLVLLFLALSGLAGAGTLARQARHAFGLPGADELAREVDELHSTLQDVVRAVDAERRRIERDLHDGVQQNVVSLSLVLARARRADDPQRSAALLEQAHGQSQALIEEVRQVAWRVYPTALDEHGLVSALEGVAASSPLPVRLATGIEHSLPPAVESAAYFVVREAVTNVVKHAAASEVLVEVGTAERQGSALLRLTVRDDGVGGADPEGGGLQGLARRAAALDGTLEVRSPRGGPTVISAELPCD